MVVVVVVGCCGEAAGGCLFRHGYFLDFGFWFCLSEVGRKGRGEASFKSLVAWTLELGLTRYHRHGKRGV